MDTPFTPHARHETTQGKNLSTTYYATVCLLVIMFTSSMGISFAQQRSTSDDVSADGSTIFDIATETDRATVLFSARGDMYTFSDIVDNNLYKGMTLYFNAKANLRYAVVSRSTTIDTLQRLIIKNISVYRDLYLGDDAGIIFTPEQDEQVVLTVFTTGKLDGTYTAQELRTYRAQNTQFLSSESTRGQGGTTGGDAMEFSTQDNVRTVDDVAPVLENAKLGEYLVWVYQLPSDVPYTNLPFRTDATLSDERTLAQRVADEYRLSLNADSRLYVRMSSQVFDSLLEVSDRYGRTIVSDDWGDEYSLITLEVPATDDYFVTATSFDGLHAGDYHLEGRVSTNELIEEVRGQITSSDTKILQKYAYEYQLDMGGGEYRAVDIHALNATIDVALVNDALYALYYETIPQGETRIIPLYVAEDGTYKLVLLSEQRQASNFILRVFE